MAWVRRRRQRWDDAVLSAIAAGCHKTSDLAARLGGGDLLTDALDRLEDAQLIETVGEHPAYGHWFRITEAGWVRLGQDALMGRLNATEKVVAALREELAGCDAAIAELRAFKRRHDETVLQPSAKDGMTALMPRNDLTALMSAAADQPSSGWRPRIGFALPEVRAGGGAHRGEAPLSSRGLPTHERCKRAWGLGYRHRACAHCAPLLGGGDS
jgi:hypothetical protein